MSLNLQKVLRDKMSSSKKPANPQNEDLKTAEKLAAEYNVKSEKPQNEGQQKTAEKLKVGTRTDLVQNLDKVSTKEKLAKVSTENIMSRLKKRFDNALLTKIRSAVYFGGANYEIAQRLKIDRKTWYNWRQNDAVKKAIKQGNAKRWKRNIQQMGWNYEEVEADFDRMAADLDQLNTDYNMETFTEGGYLCIVETVRTANGIKRTKTRVPELVPIEELLKPENL